MQRITFLVDDINGSDAGETVTFALDGLSYEIDLNGAHASELRAGLRPYLDAGRKMASARTKVRRVRQSGGSPGARIQG